MHGGPQGGKLPTVSAEQFALNYARSRQRYLFRKVAAHRPERLGICAQWGKVEPTLNQANLVHGPFEYFLTGSSMFRDAKDLDILVYFPSIDDAVAQETLLRRYLREAHPDIRIDLLVTVKHPSECAPFGVIDPSTSTFYCAKDAYPNVDTGPFTRVTVEHPVTDQLWKDVLSEDPKVRSVVKPPKPEWIVVGNGPSLLGSGLGPLIDSFPNVLRINSYVTEGFEEDTGEKTTHWFFYSHAPHRPHTRDQQGRYRPTPGVQPETLRMQSTARTWWHRHPEWPNRKALDATQRFLKAHPRFEPLPLEVWQGLRDELRAANSNRAIVPSSGLTMIHYLLRHLEVPCVAIAGFDNFMAKDGLHHYYSKDKHQPASHCGKIERAWLNVQRAEGRVVLAKDLV